MTGFYIRDIQMHFSDVHRPAVIGRYLMGLPRTPGCSRATNPPAGVTDSEIDIEVLSRQTVQASSKRFQLRASHVLEARVSSQDRNDTGRSCKGYKSEEFLFEGCPIIANNHGSLVVFLNALYRLHRLHTGTSLRYVELFKSDPNRGARSRRSSRS